MKLFFYLVFYCLVFLRSAFAGDTIRVMQYNLLYYDKNVYGCNSTNNNVDYKDGYLRDITGNYKPDVFTVNEMNGSLTSVQRILNNVFNINGVDYYKRANYTGEYIVNMLYYNSTKLELKSQTYILTSPRLTDVYTLYLKDENLAKGDTTFLTFIVTHLKAGSTSSDASSRYQAAQQIMAFINNRSLSGNIFLMGDFNVYRGSELAFQTFLTPTTTGVRFFDPVDAIGEWQDNPLFSNYHTQSTHISSSCHSGGGMDDRFDFILTTSNVLEGTNGVRYVDGSYWAFGQDGNRLNGSLVDPPNYSLPSNIIYALYNMSDHLPVVLKLVPTSTSSTGRFINNRLSFMVKNPVTDVISYWKDGGSPELLTVRILNILGTVVYEETKEVVPGKTYSILSDNLNQGIYIFVAQNDKYKFVKRLVKQ